MIKLVILIEPPEDNEQFMTAWPNFLRLAEEMPGLQEEATSQVDHLLYGNNSYVMMHELFFNTMTDATLAMSSSIGQAAGEMLQNISGGKLVLFFADYKQDSIENIRKYKKQTDQAG